MLSTRFTALLAAATVVALGACDQDPARPKLNLELMACPVGPLDINSPVSFTFNEPLLPSTVTSANVVVTDAVTGLPIAGSLAIDAAGTTVTFSPSQPFKFDEQVRFRVQNLISLKTNEVLAVTPCQAVTIPPPITELFWNRLPSASGTRLIDVTETGPDSGYALSEQNPLYKRESSDFRIVFSYPAFNGGESIDFLTTKHGFAAFADTRVDSSYLLETRDGATTFDTAAVVEFDGLDKLFFTDRLFGINQLFAVAAGGNSSQAVFWKYDSATKTLSERNRFGGTSGVNDVDFGADTITGAAVSQGLKVGSVIRYGEVFVTNDGGSSWSEVTNARADSLVLTYKGVAMRSNGDIYVTGGKGTVLRLTPAGGGAYTVTPILQNVVSNPDTTNPAALIYTDVEFAKGNDNVGWIIGAQLIGVVGGVPQYRGLIFITRDGGQTWIRQGVRGAANYGAEFPRLNRISVLSPTHAWIVGDGGTVLDYAP